MELIWSPQSLEDIEQIGDYIALDSPNNATKFSNAILESVERLSDFPESGPLVPENPMFRQLTYQGYRVVYFLELKQISIITVLSPGRLLTFK